jgi:hypothetical protein
VAALLVLGGCGDDGSAGNAVPDRQSGPSDADRAAAHVLDLAAQACTTGTFKAVDAREYCQRWVLAKVSELCEPADVPLPPEMLAERCDIGVRMLEGWAAGDESTLSYPGEQDTGSDAESEPSPGEGTDPPPELKGIDPNDPEDCPPTGPMPADRRAACGLE